jgi:uracil permease
MERRVIQVDEKVPILRGLPLSLQHLFAMFGASVLVPFYFNQAAQNATGIPNFQVIDPSLVLLLNGIGTLIYLFICKGKAPAFLGSSFAFIAPVTAVIAGTVKEGVKQAPSVISANFSHALGGFILSGLIFTLVALLIGAVGTRWLDVVLPPAAMGPIVALIGLELAGTAVNMATKGSLSVVTKGNVFVALFTLLVAIFGSLLFRKFFAIIPILVAVAAGYGASAIMNIYYPGFVNYSAITGAHLLKVPTFVTPSLQFSALLVIAPAALVVISEHIGHLFVTSKITGRNLIKDPGLHRSLLGDGLSTMISGLSGSVPTTTYGENMGVMAITKVYSVWVIGGAAVISIILAFFGNLSGFISSIPVPVMGGICILLFGVIAASGMRILVEAQVDYSKSKNLILTAVILIVGISGVGIKLNNQVELKGMVLATIVGMLLSLVIFILEKLKLTNETED